MPPNSYAFGDGDQAARRLQVVAKVFRDPSCAFLRRAVPAAPALAVDLGCGPGHTTRLLRDVTASARTVGIDSSGYFLAMARRTAGTGIDFARHDVRSVPFPVGPADVIYSRLLLAHLPEPAALVDRWVTQLRPGGILALDEVEYIRTTNEVLARYVQMVVALVAAHGAAMYAGPILGAMTGGDGWSVPASDVVAHQVPSADAAAMFALNLPTWAGDPAITRRWTAADIQAMAGGLADLTRSSATGEISWGMRQVIIERNETAMP
jgi:trans-aconitate 2-methyltransferase